MTEQEVREKLDELAKAEGQEMIFLRGEVSTDGEPRLVYDEVRTVSESYFSPLGKTTLKPGLEWPDGLQNRASGQEKIGQAFLKLSHIQTLLEKEPLAYDTTPELKAQYEKKLAHVESLKNAPQGSVEEVFYQTFQDWMEVRKNYHESAFGCEASALHEALAAAVAKADHYQHPELPEKMLVEYDPFLVSTDSLSVEQLAAIAAGNMWQHLSDVRASAEAASNPKLVYSTQADLLVDDQLEYFSKYDRSDEVYGFLEWRSALTDGDWMDSPHETFELLENLYDRLVESDQMNPKDRPDFEAIEEADANVVSMLAALASRIDTSKDGIQKVVEEWMQDNSCNLSAREENSLLDQALLEVDNAFYEATRSSSDSEKEQNGLLFVMPESLNDTDYTPDEVIRWGVWQDGQEGEITQDIRQFFSDYYPDSRFKLVRHPDQALSLTVEGNFNPMLIIPDARFNAIMKENPELRKKIRARAIEAGLNDTESPFFDYYVGMTHDLPREVMENRLENQLLNTKYITAASRDAMLDIVLTVPPENIHKRMENLIQEGKGFESAFREAMYAPHVIDRTRPEFRALQDLAKNSFTDENASHTLQELVPKLVGRDLKSRNEAKDTLMAIAKEKDMARA